jgi:hypothetical protein
MDDYDIILFYVIFMLLFNFIVLGFSGSIVNGADYLNKQEKMNFNSVCVVDFIGCAINSIGFVLNLSIPATSNIYLVTIIFKVVYFLVILPYSILIVYMILKYIRGI